MEFTTDEDVLNNASGERIKMDKTKLSATDIEEQSFFHVSVHHRHQR